MARASASGGPVDRVKRIYQAPVRTAGSPAEPSRALAPPQWLVNLLPLIPDVRCNGASRPRPVRSGVIPVLATRLQIEELSIPATLDDPDAAGFIEMVGVRNAIEVQLLGSGALAL